jgi:flagellar hook assembly protein FlgD
MLQTNVSQISQMSQMSNVEMSECRNVGMSECRNFANVEMSQNVANVECGFYFLYSKKKD